VTHLERHEDGVAIVLGTDEVAVLVTLARSLAARISHAEHASADDAVLERLSPAVSHGDDDVDREIRALLRPDLLGGREQRLHRLCDLLIAATPLPDASHDSSHHTCGDPSRAGSHAAGDDVSVTLTPEQVMFVVQAFNDIRIALGASIGIDDLERDAITAEDPRQPTLALIDALGWLQGGLIETLEA
jgi:hypothetical protein